MARPRTNIVRLTNEDRQTLQHLTRKGKLSVRVLLRARVLLLLDQGKIDREVREAVGCSGGTVQNVCHRFCENTCIADALYDKPRPGQPKKVLPTHETFVVATACSKPPTGHSHWTVGALKAALLAAYEKLPSVSDERIRQILICHDLKPWREKNVVYSGTHRTLS
jgi:transposase